MRPVALLPMLVLLSPAAAQAETVAVDCADLQTKLNDSTVVDITLKAGNFCDGTYYLRSHDLTLRGATDASGNNLAGFQNIQNGRSLTTDPGVDVDQRSRRAITGKQTIDHLTFRGTDHAAGGMYYQGEDLTISNTIFQDIQTDGSGGGLLVQNTGSPQPTGKVTLTGDQFLRNTTLPVGGSNEYGSGGGARITAGDVTVTGTIFTDNTTGGSGGGLALTQGSDFDFAPRVTAPADPDASIAKTSFDGNKAGETFCEGAGGGLYAGDFTSAPDRARDADSDSGVLSLSDNTYTGNILVQAADCNYESDIQGGGAAFIGIRAIASGPEIYTRNAAHSRNGGAFGGGFALDASELSSAEYTGQNTVVTNNVADKDPVSFRAGRPYYGSHRPAGAGIAVSSGVCGDDAEADPFCGSRLDLTHATITGNTLASTDSSTFENSGPGIGVDAMKYNSIKLDRTIVAFNSITGSTQGSQVNQDDGAPEITNSDVTDLCVAGNRADAEGNICADPIFVNVSSGAARNLQGSPVQDPSSPTVDAVDPVPGVTDDFLHKPRPGNTGSPKADMGAHEIQPKPVVSPEPTVVVTASPTPVVTARPTPTPDDDGVQGENGGGKSPAERCAGRRYFPIVLRRIGYTFVKAKIKVNGKRVRTIKYRKGIKKGRLGARIDLRKFPRRTIKIKIVATTNTGKVIKGKRVYHPCYRGRRPHTIPEL